MLYLGTRSVRCAVRVILADAVKLMTKRPIAQRTRAPRPRAPPGAAGRPAPRPAPLILYYFNLIIQRKFASTPLPAIAYSWVRPGKR